MEMGGEVEGREDGEVEEEEEGVAGTLRREVTTAGGLAGSESAESVGAVVVTGVSRLAACRDGVRGPGGAELPCCVGNVSMRGGRFMLVW